jgi:hypothetical protein
MAMRFVPIQSAVPNIDVWRATRDNYTFIISCNHNEGDRIQASIKAEGATMFDGGRLDLGTFESWSHAENACRKWKPS